MLKSREFSLFQNIYFHCLIVLKICTEHDNDTAVLGEKIKTIG